MYRLSVRYRDIEPCKRHQCFSVGEGATLNLDGMNLTGLGGALDRSKWVGVILGQEESILYDRYYFIDEDTICYRHSYGTNRIPENIVVCRENEDGMFSKQVGEGWELLTSATGTYIRGGGNDNEVYLFEPVSTGSVVTNAGTVNLTDCIMEFCGYVENPDYQEPWDDDLIEAIQETEPGEAIRPECDQYDLPAIFNAAGGELNITGGEINNSPIYTEPIRWAQSTGVVLGYSDEAFGPSDNVTREQLAAILMRYAAYRGIDVSERADLAAFTDVGEISAWALENVKWANAVGLIKGRTDTTIVPTGTATRAEAATMVQRFCENVLKK